MTAQPRTRWVAALLALAAAVGACAGDDGDGDTAADTPATTEPATTAAPATGDGEPATTGTDGCGKEPPVPVDPDAEPVDVPQTIDVGGQQRTYLLTVPPGYDPDVPTPVVLSLHGATMNAQAMSAYSRLATRGAERGFIVATPDAVDGMWELAGAGPDDDFLMALLDHLEASFCVDPDRIHAAGISLGSWKATITACTHPERFASLALVAEEVAVEGCALPVVAFHGTGDDVVPYGEGADPGVVVNGPNAGLPGVEVNMPMWARNNGCATEPVVERVGDDVERWEYPDCSPGAGVAFYSILHGGHTWPGSPIELPAKTTRTIDATEIALDWFGAHPRR